MVALDQFERTYGSAMRRLLDAGWSRTDVEGLLSDWPGLRLVFADDLTNEACRIADVGLTPD